MKEDSHIWCFSRMLSQGTNIKYMNDQVLKLKNISLQYQSNILIFDQQLQKFKHKLVI